MKHQQATQAVASLNIHVLIQILGVRFATELYIWEMRKKITGAKIKAEVTNVAKNLMGAKETTTPVPKIKANVNQLPQVQAPIGLIVSKVME